MSITSVKEHLKKYNLDNQIITMNESTATVKEAAISLKCEEKEIAKTLSFKTKTDIILIVMAGDVKIDNSKYREKFHEKAKMLSSEEVEIETGHPVGGVCPFGINKDVKLYLDKSLKRFKYIYPACGSPHNAIKISIDKLEEVTNYPEWIDVCKVKD